MGCVHNNKSHFKLVLSFSFFFSRIILMLQVFNFLHDNVFNLLWKHVL